MNLMEVCVTEVVTISNWSCPLPTAGWGRMWMEMQLTCLWGHAALRMASVRKNTRSLLSSSLKWKDCPKIWSAWIRGLTGQVSSAQKGRSHCSRSSADTSSSLQSKTRWEEKLLRLFVSLLVSKRHHWLYFLIRKKKYVLSDLQQTILEDLKSM